MYILVTLRSVNLWWILNAISRTLTCTLAMLVMLHGLNYLEYWVGGGGIEYWTQSMTAWWLIAKSGSVSPSLASLLYLHKSMEEQEGGLGTEAISHICTSPAYIRMLQDILILILTTCQGMMTYIIQVAVPDNLHWYSSAELPPRAGLMCTS